GKDKKETAVMGLRGRSYAYESRAGERNVFGRQHDVHGARGRSALVCGPNASTAREEGGSRSERKGRYNLSAPSDTDTPMERSTQDRTSAVVSMLRIRPFNI